MKVEALTIRNFKGIKHERLSIKGSNVYVFGRNAMGKTSFLDAIFKILAGKNMPSMPTAQGEKSGDIELDMGEFIVKAKFNAKNEKVSITVETREGANYPSPRAFLDQKIGVMDFDINKFFELSPKKQVEQIKSMAGIDFSDIDEAYKDAYDERTFINRKAAELEAKLEGWDKNNITLTDLTEATRLLNEKREFNKSRKDGQDLVDGNTERRKKIAEEIKALKSQIEKLETEDTALFDVIIEGQAWLNDPQNKAFEIETEEAAFLQAIEDNKIIQKNIDNQVLYEEFKTILEKQKALNETLDKCQAAKENAIKEAELPVPGLSFNDDGLTYHGLPFEAAQINKAQQIIIGLQINLALLGDVKIARFEGSLIDNENMEYIEDWAHKKGLQLFVEMVDRSAENLRIEVKEIQ